MDALLQQHEKWKETCKRLQQDIYRLERQIDAMKMDMNKKRRDYKERLIEKDNLISKMDTENQRLRDEIGVLELEINILKTRQCPDTDSDVSLPRWCC